MFLETLKSIYDYHKKHSTFLYKLFKNTKLVFSLSEKYKSNRFKDHMNKTANEAIHLYEILEDEISRHVLNTIIDARKRGMWSRGYSGINSQPQYFIPEILNFNDRYTLIDAGAYIGDTIDSFIELVGENYNEIFCFEPEPRNLDKLRSNVIKNKLNRITIVDKGLYSNTQSINFAIGSNSGSKINPHSSSTINVVTLDDYFKEYELVNPLLKMDIEGAEPDALIGAYKFINKYRPLMAICIYHEPEHLFAIPSYIREKHPYYEFLIRHHSSEWRETVLYCLPKKF